MTVPTLFEPARSDRWQYLATTNRKLEGVAIDEIADLVGAEGSVLYPGVVRFSADPAATTRLHRCSRSLHRVLLELARCSADSLADIVAATRALDVPTYLGPEQSFAVRARRRGDHPFESPDVEEAVGQAVVDEYRSRERTRPPVDLEDPDVLFRVFVRGDRALLTIDTTGQRSLHRRWYRRREHEAPLRPTVAYAMLRYAAFEPGDRLVDPMCGCGTIPIEAALLARGRSPTPDRDSPAARFRFLDAPGTGDQQTTPRQSGACSAAGALDEDSLIAGADTDVTALTGARENASVAGVETAVDLLRADARTLPVDGDVLVSDMPFGVRTDDRVHALYAAFFEAVEAGSWDSVVVLTAREDLVGPEPDRSIPIRRGRLDASILVFE